LWAPRALDGPGRAPLAVLALWIPARHLSGTLKAWISPLSRCFSLEASPSVLDGLDGRGRRWDLPGVSQRLQPNRRF
ncbi:hypothetical protein LEMLEM_LOCUS27259, partial [Lemmus lemmus]